ncbi:MAG: alpha/beta hydrolase [Oleispira sp.]|nr:alpha/beta hydrolase [Oleispira sp.]MBL4882697.1 alpha/beta hydrolase [Oleispira sp.]
MYSLEEWKKSGEIIHYKGNEIFYRDEGEGDVILCIHGYPSSSWDWHKIWPEITKNHRVIALDMLGFGFSSKPEEYNYSIADQTDIHLELLKSLGIKSFQILAHDFGIFIGQELVARNDLGELDGFKVNSLCAMSGSIFPELYNPRLIQRLLLSPVGWLIQKLFTEDKFCTNLSSVFGANTQPTKRELSSYWFLLKYNSGDKMVGKLLFYIADRKTDGDRWVEAWQETKLPVLLIIGLADPMYGAGSIDRYKVLTKQKNLACLKDIGHFPQVESPTEVVDVYKEFLKSL